MSPRALSILFVLALCRAALATPASAPQTLYVGSTITIPIQLHENLTRVLVANIDGMDVPLQFDLGDRTPLVLQQPVLDSIKAVPTGDASKLRGALRRAEHGLNSSLGSTTRTDAPMTEPYTRRCATANTTDWPPHRIDSAAPDCPTPKPH